MQQKTSIEIADAIHVSRITLKEIRLPLVEPFRTAGGAVDSRRIILLYVEDADGVATWSECVAEAAPSYGLETVDGAWHTLSANVIPLTLGRVFARPAEVGSMLSENVAGHRMARAAVEMAAWAIGAQRQDAPLASYLCRASEIESAPRESVETGIALGMQPTRDDLMTAVARAKADGYRRIKLKIAPGADVEIVTSVRALLGDGVALSVDANGSYSLAIPADVSALEALDTLGLSMIEQPFADEAMAAHAQLQRALRTPICLDESILDQQSAVEMITLGSGRIVNLKPGRVGGFAESIAIHDRCVRAGIESWCGGMLECGIGRAYNVALASLPGFTLPGDLSPSSRYWDRDVIISPWVMSDDGFVSVPLEKSGLGVEADTSFIDELTVREAVFSAS